MRTLKSLLILWNISFIAFGARANHADIFLLLHDGFKGEMAMLRSIGNATESCLQASGWETTKNEILCKGTPYVLDGTAMDQLGKASNPTVVIMAGASGAGFADQLKDNPNLILVESSHQLEKFQEDVVKKVDVLAIPAHVLSEGILARLKGHRAFIAPTRGVAHTSTADTLQAAYAKHMESLPAPRTPVVFILGGDAPDSEGRTHYYTKEDVDKNLEGLSKHLNLKDHSLLVFNGFRTGRFDPTSEDPAKPRINVPEPHKKYKDASGMEQYAVDGITTYAVEQLKTIYGLTEGEDFFVYDFHDGEPSMLEAAYGLALAKKGYIVLPGESTSMITQALDAAAPAMPMNHVLVYEHGAMNPGHRAYLQNDSRIRVLGPDGDIIPIHDPSVGLRGSDDIAANTIAKAVLGKVLGRSS